jgi:hypothetical protein
VAGSYGRLETASEGGGTVHKLEIQPYKRRYDDLATLPPLPQLLQYTLNVIAKDEVN